MERELVGLIGLLGLFVLILLRIPVALAMLATGVVGSWVLSLVSPVVKFGPYLLQFKSALWNSVANYDLSVVPLFVLMGFLAAEAGLSRDLFQGMSVLTRRLKGGIAMATITACAGFGAVSGSSIATASTMSRVSLPEFKRFRYDDGFATGVLAAGGTLGILIPPSVALVIYAIVVEGSIIEMFQAAILPGLIAVAFFLFVIWLRLRLNPALAPETPNIAPRERREALRRLIPVVVIFGSIILGLGIGLFTPTPAAAVGVFMILVYGIARGMRGGEGVGWAQLHAAFLSTARTAGMIYFILFSADILKGFFARSGLPIALSDWAAGSGLDPYTILIAMLVILIVLGCFMESLSMILVIVPFFWPVLIDLNGGDYATASSAAFGMDSEDLKIWFGILALVVVELGLITPPVGLNVFVIKSFTPETSITTIFRGVLPFFGIELVRIALILAFPALCLFMPGLL
ncbi:MAG: TRAP transporter large permease [Pseudomonadota bacterium]